jgi:3-phenylpropionate/cinnamic acid dioxygenase small subunit
MILIYRDAMKVASLISQDPVRIESVRANFRQEFRKHRRETDQAKIEEFKDGIVRFMSNYFLYSVRTELIKNEPKTIYETDSDNSEESASSSPK